MKRTWLAMNRQATRRGEHSELCILSSLQHPKFAWRYANSVEDEVGLYSKEVELSALMKRGLVRSGRGTYGEIWTITAVGKDAYRQHQVLRDK